VPKGVDGQQRHSWDSLLEREEALSALSRVAEAARSGHAQVLFLEGGAGLGKSELLQRAAAEGPWTAVGWSAGSPMESGLAFSYLGQALETLGFADLVSGAPDSSGTELRVRLFVAVRDWLVEKATAGPVLVALDDLHWADKDSLALLSFLCRRLARAPVAIVATLRPWPDGAAALALDLVGAGMAEIQSLGPLSDEAAHALYLAEAPQERNRAQAEVVVRLASGNPLLVVEAAQAPGPLAEVGVQAAPQVKDAMLQALLLSSFGALTEDARSCVQAGSVLGSPFRLGLVEEVSGLGHNAADAGIETLFAAGLLHPAGPGRAAFRHDLVAEAVYGDLDEGRRRRLHERAWRALAKRGEAALATAHALPADLVGLSDAVDVAHRAGLEALRSGAGSSAAQLLTTAETLGGPSADADLATDLAEALVFSGHPDEALAACERALSVTRAGAAIHLRALGLLGRAALLLDDTPRAATATEAALKLAADEDPDAFVAFAADEVWRIGTFVGLAPALARLDDLHRQAVSLGAGSARYLEGIRAFLAIQAGQTCDLGPLEETARAVAETPRAADLSALSAPWNPATLFVLASAWTEDFEAGELRYRSLTERVGAKEPIVSNTALTLAYVGMLFRQGRLGEGAVVAVDAAQASEVIAFGAGVDLNARAFLALQAARCDEAAALANACQSVADARGYWFLSCTAAYVKGIVLLASGRVEEAAVTYRDLAETASVVGLKNPCVVPWASGALVAFHRSGRPDEVAALVRWLEEVSTDSPWRWPLAMAALGRGFLAEDAADHPAADRAFEEALDLLRSVRLPLELAQAALVYGATLRRRGERRRARVVVAEAAQLAATCGSALLAGQARDEQARLGARRARGRSQGLTDAEATVAVLASRGASNLEIADTLVVSVRTVETHLSKVYAKLGLQSRRQLMVRFPDGAGLEAGSPEGGAPHRDTERL
jgi:DNA-binding CsgD family transcriptional regulator